MKIPLQSKITAFFTLIIASATACLSLLIPSEAKACSPPLGETKVWTMPKDSEIVGPHSLILVAISGDLPGVASRDVKLVHENGNSISFSIEHQGRAYGTMPFTRVESVKPDEFLEAGQYFLHYNYQGCDLSGDFSVSFTVDDSIVLPPVPDPVDFEWYRKTLSGHPMDSCDTSGEYNYVIPETPSESAAWIKITFARKNNELISNLIIRPSEDEIDRIIFSGFSDVDCIQIVPVLNDGTEGPETRHCHPHKCADLTYDENNPSSTQVDWESIKDCNGSEKSVGCDTGSSGNSPFIALIILFALLLTTRIRAKAHFFNKP